MTTPADYADARDGLTLLLGPRQADLMRLFWAHGPATVRRLQQWLMESDLAYSTIATLCLRLVEKGLLRQQVGMAERHNRGVAAAVYTPRIAEAEFIRTAVTQQLDRLLAHYPELVCSYVTEYAQRGGASAPLGDTDNRATESGFGGQGQQDRIEMRNSELGAAVDPIAALSGCGTLAQRQTVTWEAQARRAQHQAKLAMARLEQAEACSAQWEAAAHRATAQALAAEEDADAIVRRAALQQQAAARSAPEYFDLAGVCRVCHAPVPDAPPRRRDGLRVCTEETCRQEARRRDQAARQRALRARWRMRRAHESTLARWTTK